MTNPRSQDQFARGLLLSLALITFGWHVNRLDAQSLWRDEVDAIFFAVRDLPATLSMFVEAGQNGALFFLALRPWLGLVGSSEFALRFPSVLVSVLGVPLIWQVARFLIPGTSEDADSVDDDEPVVTSLPKPRFFLWRVVGNAPFLAAIFLAFNPYQLWYSQEGKMYALITILTLFATWFWLQGIERGGWRPWLFYLITVSIAIYSHLLMVLLIPLHLAWFVIAWPQSRDHWRGYGLSLAGLTLPYLPLVWWQWEMLTAADIRTGFAFKSIPGMLETLLLNHSRGFMPPSSLIWLAPILFLGLAGMLMGILEIRQPTEGSLPRISPLRRYLLVLSWLLLPILFIYLISLRQPVFTARYVIWIAPAAMMFMALGMLLVWHNLGSLAKPITTVLLVYVLAFWIYAGWQQKSVDIKYDLRSAVTNVSERRAVDELLILQIPHTEYAYRYYSGNRGTDPFAGSNERLGWWAGGLWTNNDLEDEQAMSDVAQQMVAITAGASQLWVVRSEVEMWDRRHLMDRWLDEHAILEEQLDYHGTQVRRYRFE